MGLAFAMGLFLLAVAIVVAIVVAAAWCVSHVAHWGFVGTWSALRHGASLAARRGHKL